MWMKAVPKFIIMLLSTIQAGTAVSTKGVFKIGSCIQDVISATYYARNINFNNYKPGDKIPFDMFLDNEIYHLVFTV